MDTPSPGLRPPQPRGNLTGSHILRTQERGGELIYGIPITLQSRENEINRVIIKLAKFNVDRHLTFGILSLVGLAWLRI